MPLADVREGMIGEARTVVHGFEPSPYKVEIIGIEHGALPGTSMILARVEGPYLDKHGIVAGMSGSPVFINGKVVGAIAYGWSFSYTPIAGITPIEQMFKLWDDLDHKKEKPAQRRVGPTGAAPARASSGWDWRPEWESYLKGEGVESKPQPLLLHPTSPAAAELSGGQAMEMVPLSSPIFVAGASRATNERLTKFFGARGLDMLAAGAGSGSSSSPLEASPPIKDGSAVGIPFMTGDLSISGMGTVTYRRGDKLLAFGHPMFGEGSIDAPMAQCYTFGYLQSYNRSFKMGEIREIVGTVRQDREFAIGGVFGEAPDRVPITVTAHGPLASNPRTFHFSAWADRNFLPMLAGTALEESFTAAVAEAGEATADCHYVITLGGGGKIEKTLRASSRGGVTFDFFMSMLQDLFLLVNNPYQQVKVDAIDVDLDARPGFRVDTLLQAEARRTLLKPGQTVEIDTRWQPYRGEEYTRRLTLKLPEKLAKGYYAVHMADGAGSMSVDQRHDASRFRPLNVDEAVDLAKRMSYPTNRLNLYLYEPDLNLSLKGASMQGSPDTLRGLIAATAPDEGQTLVIGRQLSAQSAEFDFPVRGQASFLIEVQPYIPQ